MLRKAIGAWLCRHGRHKLEPWTGPNTQNIGQCERCGTIHALSPGPLTWTIR